MSSGFVTPQQGSCGGCGFRVKEKLSCDWMVICSPLGVGMPLMTGVVKCFEKLGTSVQDRSHWNFSIQLKITHHKGSCHWRSQSGTSGCKSAPKKFKKSVKSHFCGSSKKKMRTLKQLKKKSKNGKWSPKWEQYSRRSETKTDSPLRQNTGGSGTTHTKSCLQTNATLKLKTALTAVWSWTITAWHSLTKHIYVVKKYFLMWLLWLLLLLLALTQ